MSSISRPDTAVPPVKASSPAPAGAGRRIDVLDVLRGIAILGTLGTNIWLFTHPAGPPSAFSLLPESGSTVETVLRYLTNGKFLALLTLLFGVGLELQYRSALRKGKRWPGRYLWRTALLFLEGALHFVLVFEFDVLVGYAFIALIVAHLIGRGERSVRRWMVAMGTVHLALISLLTLALLTANASGGSFGDPGLYATGSYAEQVEMRLDRFVLYRFETLLVIPMGVVLFLLGSRLLRAGAFENDERGTRLRNRLMLVGLGAGAPLNLVTAFAGPEWFLVDRYVLPPLVAVGLLGLVTTLALRATGAPGPLRRGVTAVGRTALSGYVFQNLAASALCYGWGLGLAARLDWARPWWPVLAWAAIVTALLVLSSLWLRRFSRGPLELVWHWAYLAPLRGNRS
ncbi:DUF418 domain-containing protein [Actinocorallia populi]|uniref:DUF418 domain-containing protein n=1 Tax=Actinocorallia populi TaxID=2079200 RepID=UPI000D097BB1|nr:DUF418 domain-containing protein [Actinocorallia populi]